MKPIRWLPKQNIILMTWCLDNRARLVQGKMIMIKAWKLHALKATAAIALTCDGCKADLRIRIYLLGFFSVWSIRSTPSSVEEFRGFRPLFLGSFGSFSFFSLNQFCNLNSIVLFPLNVRNWNIFQWKKKPNKQKIYLFVLSFGSLGVLGSFGVLGSLSLLALRFFFPTESSSSKSSS